MVPFANVAVIALVGFDAARVNRRLERFEQKETKRTKGARVFVCFVIFCGFSFRSTVRGGFLSVYFACLAVTFPVQWHGLLSKAART